MNLQENIVAEKQRVFGEFEEKEISVSDHINGLQYTSTKSDNFVVDMERFSHIIEKDINSNSRITVCFPCSFFVLSFCSYSGNFDPLTTSWFNSLSINFSI